MKGEDQEKRMRLLLVGDEIYTIFLIQSYLESCGCEVASTVEGDDALKFLQHETPDLVIFCNDGVVKMDGYTFLQRLRKNSQTYKLPVILMSSKNQTSEQIQSLNHEMDAYMTRPFELDELKAKVQAMTERSFSFA
jgi:DNA-binding response OmpR family regulator